MSNLTNRRRAFADVVTIDAWHKPFSAGVSKVDLHADVVFGTARIGGDADSPVRFRLSLKRAEVVIVLPDNEPVKVDKASVARDNPEVTGQVVRTVREQSAKGAAVSVGADASPQNAAFTIAGNAHIGGSCDATKLTETTAPFQPMTTMQSRTADGDYRWEVSASGNTQLNGRPWDADQVRLTLVDQRTGRAEGLPPCVRLEVRCRREDLHIEDLVLKDEAAWTHMVSRSGHKNRIAAAISYIRSQLQKEGLEFENLLDPFGELTLGSVLAEHG